jgi:hypothetical protein
MDFIHLKRTYPTSTLERECDAYKFFTGNTTEDQRKEWGVDIATMKKTIQANEKYIYQVGKEDGKFKVVCSSFENFALIRKYIYGVKDEL